MAGRSVVTRRAILDIVRTAVQGSYGVIGFADRSMRSRLARRLGFGSPGISLSTTEGLTIDLYLTVAYGVPVAEVARQVDSAVRYAIRRAALREVDCLSIHIGGLQYQPNSGIPAGVPPRGPKVTSGIELAQGAEGEQGQPAAPHGGVE